MWPTITRLVPVLSAGYLLSQFLRSSNAVIAPDLIRDLGLSAEALGGLTGVFFIAFALAQIPIGVLMDNIGPRLTMSGLMLFAVAGSTLFAVSDSVFGLTMARVFMGLGCASLFMGSLVIYARWFPPDRFTTIASVEMGIGYTGTVLATAPLALVAAATGWRGVFAGVAVFAAVLLMAFLAVVRDAPPRHPFLARRRESLTATARGIREVLRNPRLPRILPMQFVSYGAMFSVMGLWAGPYLNDVHGLDLIERGNILVVMASAAVVGLFLYGPLDRLFNTRKWLVVGGGSINAVILAFLALKPDLTLPQVTILFTALAGFNGYSIVLIAHGRSIFPDRLVARGMTVNNMVSMGGVGVLHILTGFVVGAFPAPDSHAPAEAYQWVFGLLAGLLFVALAAYLGSRDVPPRSSHLGDSRSGP